MSIATITPTAEMPPAVIRDGANCRWTQRSKLLDVHSLLLLVSRCAGVQ
jgi:hypothetical protein